MNSSMIGKIEKAHRYAKEPERVRFESLESTFQGSHDSYRVGLAGGQWHCSCHAFSSHAVGNCAHVMALQQLFAPMLSEDARYGGDDLAVSPVTRPLAN